jgi:arylsulfatase A-like enzyme
MLLLIGILTGCQRISAQLRQPNIIVFLVDDMGWEDTSVPFAGYETPLNRQFHTPNMARLAKEGMKFTNAYAAPVCTPSRTAMLSGMNPAHSHITNWTATDKNVNTDLNDGQFAPASWNINGISPVPGIDSAMYVTPFPQLLEEAGYYTIHVGKAHWAPAGTPGASPVNMGFMVNVAGHAAGNPQSYLSEENYGNMPGKATARAVPDLEAYYNTGTFLTEALTQEALKALEAPIKRKQPFFLNMAHYGVHVPIMPDKRFLQKYREAGLDSIEAAYASMIEGMDKSLGDIMDYLKKKHVDENTVIIFMSDNGGLSFGSDRGGTPYTQNLPLRSGKGSVYEGGIREPMIVKYPPLVKPGTVAQQYVIIEDFFPTILELAGIDHYKQVQEIDGKSFLPVLKHPAYVDTARTLIWHFPNKCHTGFPEHGINYCSAIRQGNWKLVYHQRDGKMELYDLSSDLGESHDLYTGNIAKARQLAALLGKQLRQWNAPMPVNKSNKKQLAWPGL